MSVENTVKVGDQVWVRTGLGAHEEPATIMALEATEVSIRFIISGYDSVVAMDRIRSMNVLLSEEKDGSGRKLRRSNRSSSGGSNTNNNASTSLNDDAITSVNGGKKGANKATASSMAEANTKAKTARVTPSSTEIDSASNHENDNSDADKMEEQNDHDEVKTTKNRKSKPKAAKPATKNARKRTNETQAKKPPANKRAKQSAVETKPKDANSIDSDTNNHSSNPKESPYFPKGDKLQKSETESPYFAKDSKKGTKSNSKAASKKNTVSDAPPVKKAAAAASSRRKKLILAMSDGDEEDIDSSSDDDLVMTTHRKSKTKAAALTSNGKKMTKGKKETSVKTAVTKAKGVKKATSKKETAAAGPKNSRSRSNNKDDNDNDSTGGGGGGEPDGNGGLNQPAPFQVDYAPSGRATCRTCDVKIEKGEVRIGHRPLFRGKPGFMVYRHLICTVFSENILCAEDVEKYDDLADEDYVRLAEQVDVSKEKIKEEMEELEPDELVQKSFEGEIRSEPPGFSGILLPFQVEGFSWMRHQEVKEAEIMGGILADEMGMGKTIQTIATVLDHRPKLQHSRPGAKHPPTADLEQLQIEDALWEKVGQDWKHEMDMLKVMKKIRSRDGGARAGTLVICPVIALSQWRTEIEKFTEEGALSVCTYHGPDRESQTPRDLIKKYDVVLTTYQVLEADFRKMTSPNRVACPNCGGKFKIDKLPIHLKYFCGDGARKTEAQARQQRNSDRNGGNGSNGSNRRRGGTPSRDDKSKKKEFKKKSTSSLRSTKEASTDTKKAPTSSTKVTGKKQSPPKNNSDDLEPLGTPKRAGSRRSAAAKAASRISISAAEWMPPNDDSDGDSYQSNLQSSSDDDSESEVAASSRGRGSKKYVPSDSDEPSDGSSSSDDSALARARTKQREALERPKDKKKFEPKMKTAGKKSKQKKETSSIQGKGNGKSKSKSKKFDDDDDDDDSSDSDESFGGADDDIDMDLLIQEAMAGAKNSVLHSICWWRIILDEAHMIKTRSSQTANAAFSLVGIHRWCLSGTPLQNRVGEFYSLVRFLRLDPMAFYYCRTKDCNCKSMHYQIVAGKCEGCGHGGVNHYSHFNKYILNPIQRDGYSGDGRRAMFTLKNEVLDKCLLRRTKATKAADMELPPRLVQIKTVRLHPVEEDFYSALYTQTKSSFDDYVDGGTLLNNYAHIFDLLIRLRQTVDHPYLVIHSKKNSDEQGTRSQSEQSRLIANGSVDCDICHEPPTDRVVSTCCGAAYCRSCVLDYMAASTGMSASTSLACPSCRGAFSIDLETNQDVEDDSPLCIGSKTKNHAASDLGMPSLKELLHVATGSILRRIDLAEFATSSKIEALTQELVMMRQTSPGSKAIVFSQFVNMLDLIRWRLHSDPYLEGIGLGARALHGGMNVRARDQVLKEFREDNNVRVLCMSLKAGGVALNLTCANHIFLMDPWWNPAAEMQAIDRTHRIGQYRPIRAVRFIAENTVEERILQLQEKKRLVFDGTVGRDAGSLKMLTVDDMKSLFA